MSQQLSQFLLLTCCCLLVSACGNSNHVAPVLDVADLRGVSVPRAPSRPTAPQLAVKTAAPLRSKQSKPVDWMWPTHGKVIRAFSTGNKGIDIASRLGEPVYAAAAGKVVYSGRGLRAYGNLLIIKHDNSYMSTYAHNKRMLVSEGMWVHRGQKIAEMGNTGSDKVMLHFEIRHQGQPINPISLYQSS